MGVGTPARPARGKEAEEQVRVGGAACWGARPPRSHQRGRLVLRGGGAAGDPASEKGDGGGGGSGRGGCHLVLGGAGDAEGKHDPRGGKPTDGKLNPVNTPELS